MNTGSTAEPGHQLERLKSEEATPFQKLPEAGLNRRNQAQSAGLASARTR